MKMRRPAALDCVLAVVVLGFGAFDLADGGRGPRAVAVAAIAVFAGCLLIRRSSLWLAVVPAFATIVVSFALGVSQQNFLSSIIACLVLAWWIGYGLRLLESILGFCYAYVCVVATSAVDLANVVWLVLVIGGAWGAGRALRSRRFLIDDLRRTTVELERSREQLAERAVAGERLRIAQEIHDVIAHSVTVMLVQAEAAERVLPLVDDNTFAAEAVRAVQDSGRQALSELRQLLGVLRPEGRPNTAPTPGLRDLAALAASYRAAGLRVDCTAEVGDDVPGNIGLTAYRVAQEALTNVLRHSQAADVRLVVRRTAEAVLVEVTDDGPTRPGSDPCGHGLVGMRERVAACGGRLDAGPQGSGFRVAAALPTGLSA